MENRLVAYAFTKTILEHNQNHADTFVPHLLKILPRDASFLTKSEIQEKISRSYFITIPIYTIDNIINKAKKQDFIIAKDDEIALKESGLKYVDSLEDEGAVSRRINELLSDIKSHLGDAAKTTDDVMNILLSFINSNLHHLVDFINLDDAVKKELTCAPGTKAEELKISEYFKLAERSKPAIYSTLVDIVHGLIISLISRSKGSEGIDSDFKGIELYLDANFLFNIFEMHHKESAQPSIELLRLLPKYGFTLKVFDFTITEMTRVLKGYEREQFNFRPEIRVDTVYSALKTKGWSNVDVRAFIAQIKSNLEKNGISIEAGKIDLKVDTPQNPEYLSKLREYKADRQELAYKHDIFAIEKIQELRDGIKFSIKESQALFLTSDLTLARFNYEAMGHQNDSSICEVMSDRLLTNILWYKDPISTKDIPLNTIISLHSQGSLVNKRIWARFNSNISRLKMLGKLSAQDEATLLYGSNIEEILSQYTEDDVAKISDRYILEDLLLEAKRRLDSGKRKEIAQKIKEAAEQQQLESGRLLALETETAEMRGADKTKAEITERIEKKSFNRARVYSWILKYELFFVCVILLWDYRALIFTHKSFLTILSAAGAAFFGTPNKILKRMQKIFEEWLAFGIKKELLADTF